MRTLTHGLAADAVGTAPINASTYLGMAVRERPPSPIPEQDAWAADVIPHLAYGAGVVLTFDALEG